MNIKIKGEHQARVQMLARLLLNDYENEIPVIVKKNNRIVELKDFSAKECLSRFQDLKDEIQRLDLINLALYQENQDLKEQLATTSKPKQNLDKNDKISTLIALLRDTQNLSFQSIADTLNNKGFTNSREQPFNRMLVNRLYTRYKSNQ